MAVRIQTHHLYEFGPFRLDVREQLLTCRGKSVSLSPKVFETLVVMVESNGRLLEKDELLKLLWPDSFVEESSLAQNIFQIRRALAEHDTERQYIETVPRRGYRFIVPVRQIQPEAQIFPGEQTVASDPGDLAKAESRMEVPAALSIESLHKQVADNTASGGNNLAAVARRGSWKIATAAGLAVLLTTVVAFGVYRFFTQRHAARASAVPFDVMRITRLTRTGRTQLQAVSPDGKYVVQVVEDGGQQSLWMCQSATSSSVQIVPPVEGDYRGVTFSHDGNYVYYSLYLTRPNQIGEIFRIPVLGGIPQKIIEDADSGLALSPDDTHLAFIRNFPLRHEMALMIARVDGSGERQLTLRKRPDSFSYDGPAWSPDGKFIAVAAMNSDPGGNYMNVVGVRVTDGGEIPLSTQRWNWVGQVAWLNHGNGIVAVAWHADHSAFADQIWHISWPQGEVRRITNDLDGYSTVSLAADASALTTIQSTRLSQIWIVAQDKSGKAVQITSGFGDNYSELLGLAWTPDGRLVYGSNNNRNTDLWMMDADGRNQRQLTTDGSSDTRPFVSADGRHIVYMSYNSGIAHIWRMNPDGTGARQLTYGPGEFSPSLSPDNKWLVYLSRREEKLVVWKMPLAGGESVPLTEEESRFPIISSDGRWVGCFLLDRPARMMRLAIIPLDGGQAGFICKKTMSADHMYIQWTPDSRALAFIYTKGGISNIWAQPIDGRVPRALTDFRSDRIYRFAWSKDGKYLACERGTTVNEVVMFSNFLQQG